MMSKGIIFRIQKPNIEVECEIKDLYKVNNAQSEKDTEYS